MTDAVYTASGKLHAPRDAWVRLGSIVTAAISASWDSQDDFVESVDLSDATVRAIEKARQTSYRVKTIKALQRGLKWSDGTVERILNGEDIPGLTEPSEPEPEQTPDDTPGVDMVQLMRSRAPGMRVGELAEVSRIAQEQILRQAERVRDEPGPGDGKVS